MQVEFKGKLDIYPLQS